jgi:hypothetical protein
VGSNLNPGLPEYKPDDDFRLVSWVNKEASEEYSVSVLMIENGRGVMWLGYTGSSKKMDGI